MKRITTILNLIYCLTVLLFLLDSLTSIDIKNQGLKSFVFFGFLIGAPIILLWNFLSLKISTKSIIAVIYPTILLIFIIVVNPMVILFNSGAWRTQVIYYQNAHQSFKKVEFQMQGKGGLGYNKRTVEVTYLTSLFIISHPVPNNIDKSHEWVRVDKDVNELGLNYP